MKVALVHDFLFKFGGAERVLEVLSQCYPNAPIYTTLFQPEKCGVFPFEKIKTSYLQQSWAWKKKKPQLLLSSFPQAIESFDFSSYDVVISSSGAFSHGVITNPSTLHISYCHSPMRYAWDYAHNYLSEKNLFWPIEWILRKKLKALRQWDIVAADRPDYYIANSQHVAKRIKKYFRKNAEVIYPPVNTERFYPYTPAQNYYFIVSALSRFKKIDLAIAACNKLGQKLFIAGEGKDKKRLQKLAGPTVSFLGRISDQEVQHYMQNCRAFLFPGEEDFGITPVEAMAAGRPVIAYNKGGVSESVIDGVTGVLFQEQNADALARAIEEFRQQEEHFNRENIRKRAEDFHTHRFTAAIKKTVEKHYQKHLSTLAFH